jgi:acyl carrier protein
MNTTERVVEMLAQHTGVAPGKIRASTHLSNDLNMKSCALHDLMLDLEVEFHVYFSAKDYSQWYTVRGLVALVDSAVADVPTAQTLLSAPTLVMA